MLENGRYEIKRELGAGFFGHVYLAYDRVEKIEYLLWINKPNFLDIEFLKPIDEYDKLLTGLPKSNKKDKENLFQKMNCARQ